MLRTHFQTSLLPGLVVALLALSHAGCCCVQGTGYAPGGCSSGNCGSGPLMGLASCRGACGEVYVDEWISEPPVLDNCGYDCGGCGSCRQCQPIRNALRLLWGTPFVTSCDTGLCGGGCESGSSVVSGGSSGCNCGQHHAGSPIHDSSILSSPQPVPTHPQSVSPEIPLHGVPQIAPGNSGEVVPTPAPAMPNSAKRLNPANRRLGTTVSYHN
ncbi:MAG: hypothetical protein R3C53_17910 [Pirellulaceae bacterium]